MTITPFFRLLKAPVDAKGDALATRIAGLNATGQAEETFTLDPGDFYLIPGSPFAYWATASMFSIFREMPPAEGNAASFRLGLKTNDDFRFLRLFWETTPGAIGQSWRYHCKGGEFSPYYQDVHLLLDWEDDAERLRAHSRERGESPSRNIRSESHYYRPGLTWPRRTQKGLNVRALPAGCIFADKGPAVFVAGDNADDLLHMLGVLNSLPVSMLVALQMAFGSYEVGVLQRTPIPSRSGKTVKRLAALAHLAHNVQRDRDLTNETTHAFCLPGLVRHRMENLQDSGHALDAETHAARSRLSAHQAEIDNLVFELYGLDEADRALIRSEMAQLPAEDSASPIAEAEDDEEEETPSIEDLPVRAQDLLMWCVGVAFGRWDVRMALDSTLLPALQGPFDPLPRRAPGALVGVDGLPAARVADIAPEAWLRARKNVLHIPPSFSQGERPGTTVDYPLSIAWDGILVDDPTHPSDIVARVRAVLELLWGEHADAVEREACEILGVKSLRDYFRDPRGFFSFHIKRYSKSRRKAPIYWLLQSEKRSYGVWLYLHRLTPMTLYIAARDYADPKVALEQARLKELRGSLLGLAGGDLRRREAEIERQDKLVAEVTVFRKRLDAVALLNLPPDLNDGVVISIAPLRELVPWKEAQRTWDALVAGEYSWSTMAQRMRERGIMPK